MHLASILPFVALPLSLAKNITIGVGERGLVFNPEVVTADVGDLLQFYFYPKNHSVAQGSFSTPCQPLTGGVYSGFMPVTAEGVGPPSSFANPYQPSNFDTNSGIENGLRGYCEQYRCHLSLLLSNRALPEWHVYGR